MQTKSDEMVGFNLRLPRRLRRRLNLYQKKHTPKLSINTIIIGAVQKAMDEDEPA